MRDLLIFRPTSVSHRRHDEARPRDYAPPAWVAFGLGLLVVAGMTVAAYVIAELFAAFGFAG